MKHGSFLNQVLFRYFMTIEAKQAKSSKQCQQHNGKPRITCLNSAVANAAALSCVYAAVAA